MDINGYWWICFVLNQAFTLGGMGFSWWLMDNGYVTLPRSTQRAEHWMIWGQISGTIGHFCSPNVVRNSSIGPSFSMAFAWLSLNLFYQIEKSSAPLESTASTAKLVKIAYPLCLRRRLSPTIAPPAQIIHMTYDHRISSKKPGANVTHIES